MQNWMMPWINPWLAPGGSTDAPLGGDVSQWIRVFSPTTVVNGAGDPALEREIVENVATYGKQIGELIDVVIELASRTELPESKALAELKTIAEAVAAKKLEFRRNALERARKALEELEQHDPEGYRLLIAKLAAEPS